MANGTRHCARTEDSRRHKRFNHHARAGAVGHRCLPAVNSCAGTPGINAATKVSTVAFRHAVFTLGKRAKTTTFFCLRFVARNCCLLSRDLCRVTLKSFSALRFLPVTLLPDSMLQGCLYPFLRGFREGHNFRALALWYDVPVALSICSGHHFAIVPENNILAHVPEL